MKQKDSKMTVRQRANVFAGIAFLTGIFAFIAQAQAQASAAAKAVDGQWNTIWDYWKVGGFAMYPIALCSVAVIGLAVYCCILYAEKKMTQTELVPVVCKALEQLDIKQAKSLCASQPGIFTNVLGAGLRRIADDEPIDIAAVEKAMDETSAEEVNSAMTPLTYLSVTSQVAPMFGLLGTVTGMIGAFNKIGMGQMGDPEKLASNIGEAMITTAFGLIVAIPAMFAYFGFKSRYSGNISRISSLLGDAMHSLKKGMRKAEIESGKFI